MKKLGLLFHFYHKSIFNLFLITAVMTVACFSILYTVGRVNYISHTKQIFEELVSNNSYCIQFGTFSEYNSEDIALYKEAYQKLVNELKSNSQIDNIDYMQHTDSLECNGENVVVFLYSDSLWEKFLALPKGDNAVSTNKDDTFFCVISGSNLGDIKEGDNLVIRSHFGNSKEKISNFFAGSHVQYPYYIPTFFAYV